MRWCYNCVQRPHSDSCCSLVAVSGRKVVYSRSRPRKSCRSCTRQIVWTHSTCPVDLSSRNYAHKWCGRKSPRADSAAPSWPSGAAVVSAATKRWREEESAHDYGQGFYIPIVYSPSFTQLGPHEFSFRPILLSCPHIHTSPVAIVIINIMIFVQ